MERKGAFQLSLSFIIVIVFAVIVLALAISWIQGIFPTVTDLTHKVTDVATERLLDDLTTGSGRVGIAAPAVTAWKRGETGSYAIGVRNVYSDKDTRFSMNVYLEEIGGDLAGRSVSSFVTDVQKWLTFSKDIFIEKSSSETSDLIIRPPADASTGIYMFRVVVCEAASCRDLNSGNLYGSAQFTIEIEAV